MFDYRALYEIQFQVSVDFLRVVQLQDYKMFLFCVILLVCVLLRHANFSVSETFTCVKYKSLMNVFLKRYTVHCTFILHYIRQCLMHKHIARSQVVKSFT